MMMRTSRLAAVSLLIAPVLFLAGCSGGSQSVEELALQSVPAEVLYNEALAEFENGSVSLASRKFEEVDKQYPYSVWARRSLIMAAYSHFESGSYPEAINASRKFLTLFPGDKDAAYAQYIIGQSYFRQIPDVTRDQRATERALNAMEELVRKYPESEYVGDAQTKILMTKDQLAGKEMQIGRYYQERKEYIASINRFKVVVRDYQSTRHVEEALHRLTESYLALGLVQEAQTSAAVLGHNFPGSEWYKDSYDLLTSGGYEPKENRGSWVSRSWKAVTGSNDS